MMGASKILWSIRLVSCKYLTCERVLPEYVKQSVQDFNIKHLVSFYMLLIWMVVISLCFSLSL
jgi:hypothetical protein